MIVYGRNPVREALRGKRRVQRVFATERAAQEVWLGGLETVIAEPWELEERCGSPDHQGICAEVGPYPYADADSLLDAEDALVLALDEVQDPHNLGAVIRVAEAAGCAGVVLPERRSAEVTAAVCRSSAGAVEHLARGNRDLVAVGVGRDFQRNVHLDGLAAALHVDLGAAAELRVAKR